MKSANEIKKMAYIAAVNECKDIPHFEASAERLMFLSMVNIYSLYINKFISKKTAEIMTADAERDFGVNVFYEDLFSKHLDIEHKCNDLSIKMSKEPNIETALEIVYTLLPPLALQRDKIDKAIMEADENETK